MEEETHEDVHSARTVRVVLASFFVLRLGEMFVTYNKTAFFASCSYFSHRGVGLLFSRLQCFFLSLCSFLTLTVLPCLTELSANARLSFLRGCVCALTFPFGNLIVPRGCGLFPCRVCELGMSEGEMSRLEQRLVSGEADNFREKGARAKKKSTRSVGCKAGVYFGADSFRRIRSPPGRLEVVDGRRASC